MRDGRARRWNGARWPAVRMKQWVRPPADPDAERNKMLAPPFQCAKRRPGSRPEQREALSPLDQGEVRSLRALTTRNSASHSLHPTAEQDAPRISTTSGMPNAMPSKGGDLEDRELLSISSIALAYGFVIRQVIVFRVERSELRQRIPAIVEEIRVRVCVPRSAIPNSPPTRLPDAAYSRLRHPKVGAPFAKIKFCRVFGEGT